MKLSCDNITLDVFIRCLVYNDLKVLGDCPDEELREIWERLYEEYAELSGNKAYSNTVSLIQRISVLEAKLQLAVIGINDMDMLNRLGYKGEINSLTGKIQKDALILQQKQKELEQVSSEKRQLKEADFTAWIVQVSKYMGYRIDRKKITVSEFIEMNKQMEKEMESLRKHGRGKKMV